jgi:sulfite reductase (NADPH) flavoprotein alpha-component
VTYESHGRERKGVCSTFLAERSSDCPVPIFPSKSKFRLPEDGDAPIIMVGPGTGVAPFRAFLQERKVIGARGKTWLFFGAQREQSDFTSDEFGISGRRLAHAARYRFPRDQVHKIYAVPPDDGRLGRALKMARAGRLFLCLRRRETDGKDVDAVLRQVVQRQGGLMLKKPTPTSKN